MLIVLSFLIQILNKVFKNFDVELLKKMWFSGNLIFLLKRVLVA